MTWSEWNARLAMPLVTSLREGKHPLLFPTDLTIEKQSNCNSNKSTLHEQSTSSSPDRKSPGFYSPNNTANCIPSNVLTSTPANSGGKLSNTNNNCISNKQQSSSINCGSGGSSGGNNSSNNNNSKVNNNYSIKCELKSSLDGTCSDNELENAGTFVDSKSGLCNISLLSSLSAMSTFMSSAAGGSSTHGLGLGSGNATSLGINSMSSGGGHPCPDCGRLYKLKSSLRNHQKWECGKEPQFKCPFCVYRAKQKMHIGRHMERMHKEKFMKFDEKIFAAAAEEAGVHLPPFLN